MEDKLKKLFEETVDKLKGDEGIGGILEEFEEKLPDGPTKEWFENFAGRKEELAKLEEETEEIENEFPKDLTKFAEESQEHFEKTTEISKKALEQLETAPQDILEEIIAAYEVRFLDLLLVAQIALKVPNYLKEDC